MTRKARHLAERYRKIPRVVMEMISRLKNNSSQLIQLHRAL